MKRGLKTLRDLIPDRVPGRTAIELARRAVAAERENRVLREALDDMWGCIEHAELQHLQPDTVEVAIKNHAMLWHQDAQEKNS